MSISDYIAAIALIVSLAAILYRRGASEEKVTARIGELERKTDDRFDRLGDKIGEVAKGLGDFIREVRAKEERRWKQQIVASVNASETLEQAKHFVNQLKDDSFRE